MRLQRKVVETQQMVGIKINKNSPKVFGLEIRDQGALIYEFFNY